MKFNRFDRNVNENKTQYLRADLAVGEVKLFTEPRIIGDWVFWLEQRPKESGRITVLARLWLGSNAIIYELTPAPINVRTRVHGYGGAALSVVKKSSRILLSWIDDDNGCLWLQSWLEVRNQLGSQKSLELKAIDLPLCLSKKGDYLLADGLIDVSRNRWLGILEADDRDFLVQFSLEKDGQEPEIIYSPKDFLGYLSLSPQGNKLAWIEWQGALMPWDSSQLWVGTFDQSGVINKSQLLMGKNIEQEQKLISIFQPTWLETGALVVAEDSSGWWNLMIAEEVELGRNIEWTAICPMEAEFAFPQWVLGMSTIASSHQRLIALVCENGSWRMIIIKKDGEIIPIDQPFDDLSGINAKDNKVVAISSNSVNENGLLEIDLNNGNWHHSPVRDSVIKTEQISIPQSIWFKGFNNQSTQCWYYPPLNSTACAPLLVKSHSGPTGMARIGLNLEIQFWTTRGWGVVDVNYGGSSGFGRSYRERLKYGWGEVDVFDCSSAAKVLINSGKADPKRIAIEGGSAGGFTTLACLFSSDIFSVAACRYPVTDLLAMTKSTHRFEAKYFDYLLGTLPDRYHIYKDRSPIENVHMIDCPVIFFQGLKDKVVLPQQTREMVNCLKQNNIPTEAYYFENEGHGFRDSNIKTEVLTLTEKFFCKYLDL